MKFYKYINDIPEKPIVGGEVTEFNPGDTIMVRKGTQANYYWEQYKVAADGLIHFVRGITDDQWSRMEQMDVGFIDKVKNDTYTKEEVDDRVTQVVSETIPVTGSVLPQGLSIPDWVTYNGKAELYGKEGGTTYTQDNGPSTTVTEGYVRVAYYNKETDLWTFEEGETPLPVQPATGQVQLGDSDAVSGDTVFKQIQPLSALIEGGSYVVGDTDFSDYATQNSQEMTFFLRMHPVIQQGFVVLVRLRLHRAGDIAIYTAEPTGGQTYRYTAKEVVEGVVGDNTFVVNLPISRDGLVGVGQIEGGGLLTTKVEANGMWLDSVPDRNVGQPVTFSNSNRAPAIGFDFEIPGFESQINIVDEKVDEASSDISELQYSAIKDSDLTIEYGGNLFNPDNIINGRYVSNTGSIGTGDGWESVSVDVAGLDAGTDLSYSGFNTASAATPVNYGFYRTSVPQSSDHIEEQNWTSDFPSGVVSVPDVEGPLFLVINIKRPNQGASVYSSAVVNVGSVPIPWEPFTPGTVTKIKGYDLKGDGGEAYDQSLNTTDNVVFNSVRVSSFETDILVAELPEGAGSPPADVQIGQAWLDTTNDSVKVRRS